MTTPDALLAALEQKRNAALDTETTVRRAIAELLGSDLIEPKRAALLRLSLIRIKSGDIETKASGLRGAIQVIADYSPYSEPAKVLRRDALVALQDAALALSELHDPETNDYIYLRNVFPYLHLPADASVAVVANLATVSLRGRADTLKIGLTPQGDTYPLHSEALGWSDVTPGRLQDAVDRYLVAIRTGPGQ